MIKKLFLVISVLLSTAHALSAQIIFDEGKGDFLGPVVDFQWTIKSTCRHPLELAVRYTQDGVRHTRGWLTLRPERNVAFRSTSNFVSYYARRDGYSWRGDAEKDGDVLIRVDLDGNFEYNDENFPNAAIDHIRFRGREYTNDTTTTLTCENR